MKTDHLGQMIFSEDDCVNMLMRGQSMPINGMLVDATVDLEKAALDLYSALDVVLDVILVKNMLLLLIFMMMFVI